MSYERLDLGLEYMAGLRAPVVEQAGYGVVVDETGLNFKYLPREGSSPSRPVEPPFGWLFINRDTGRLEYYSDVTETWSPVDLRLSYGTANEFTVSIVHNYDGENLIFKGFGNSDTIEIDESDTFISFTLTDEAIAAHAKPFTSEPTFSADFTFDSPGEYQTCDSSGAVELDLDSTNAVMFAQHYKYIPANQIDSLTASSALSADPDVFANFDPTKPYGVMAVWLPPGKPWVTGMVLPS